jgi:poly-gamma-glutamate capsule biosynthesis protein CapA/YwtB (metallophosphatase superfamily)
MVTLNNVPLGENDHRQGGLFHHLWLASFLLICSLVILQPVTPKTPEAPIIPEEKNWLYRRDGGTPAANGTTAEVLVVGDVMLGRGVAGIDDPFRAVGDLLASMDLTVGNFEGVISSHEPVTETIYGQSGLTPYRLVAPARAAAHLEEAGFDLLSLANNHSLDMGDVGLTETVERLASVGIKTIGAGNNLETAYRPVIMYVKGVRIAFLAFDAISKHPSAGETGQELYRTIWNEDRVLATIHQLDPVSDVIIVLMHWGDEYEVRAGPNQKQAALEMVGAGADVIIGSHPHVVQETQIVDKIGQRKEAFVAYSLGNFIFDQFEENSRVGLALRLFIDTNGLQAVEALPVHAGPDPELLATAESQKLIERIRPEPAWLSIRCNLATCFPAQTTIMRGSGLFRSGQIDLNGDGNLETVRLENGRVSVFEGDRLGWESLPEWRVLDVALGDPNDDGRAEMMLVLLKSDKNGKLASHPFVIGHRGGIYRQVWGGSALAIPIQEVELADVDGDGKQELIVLEEQNSGMKTIAILKWDEWVFRLFWRSAPGRYVDLRIRETGESQKVITIGQIR